MVNASVVSWRGGVVPCVAHSDYYGRLEASVFSWGDGRGVLSCVMLSDSHARLEASVLSWGG